MKAWQWLAATLVAGLAMTSARSVVANVVTANLDATASLWTATGPDPLATAPLYIVLPPGSQGSVLSFSASGSTSRDPDPIKYPLVGPDGETPGTGPNAGNEGPFESGNIVGMRAPFQSLAGVFLDTNAMSSQPSPLFFDTDAERSYIEIAPLLQQMFFVGDGLTGVGTGQVQSVTIPGGADALFLSTFDLPGGGYANNVGSLQVSVTSSSYNLILGDASLVIPVTFGEQPPTNGVPEPASLTLFSLGAVVLTILQRLNPKLGREQYS